MFLNFSGQRRLLSASTEMILRIEIDIQLHTIAASLIAHLGNYRWITWFKNDFTIEMGSYHWIAWFTNDFTI